MDCDADLADQAVTAFWRPSWGASNSGSTPCGLVGGKAPERPLQRPLRLAVRSTGEFLKQPWDTVKGMTRDEAIRVGIFTLSDWHRRDHGERCVCLEGEQLGAQSAALVDALAAEGMTFDGYSGNGQGLIGSPTAGGDRV
jgi:hypothetical protein